MTTLDLKLDENQLRIILDLVDDEVHILNEKVDKAVKDSHCSYDLLDHLTRTRNGLYYLSKLLKRKLDEHK